MQPPSPPHLLGSTLFQAHQPSLVSPCLFSQFRWRQQVPLVPGSPAASSHWSPSSCPYTCQVGVPEAPSLPGISDQGVPGIRRPGDRPSFFWGSVLTPVLSSALPRLSPSPRYLLLHPSPNSRSLIPPRLHCPFFVVTVQGTPASSTWPR